ncbi:MAG TPA: RluA family pseudouridine synthase [Candidatus Dormibacteraeota bacterium]|nr:RluA family pseudouridine synthase [Candidatus Dormibacteraeota bacterium]
MADEATRRLDLVLAEQRGITRHAAQTMVDAGLVTVNGRPGKSGQRIRPDDVIDVADAVPPARPTVTPASAAPPHLDVVYKDEWLAVIDKPAGLVVHPAPGHHGDTLADALRTRGETWSLLGGEERAGIVHRLDRDTSGLLVVARTEAAHRALAQQLRERTLVRRYWVMVQGGLREDSGTVEAPIARDPRDRKRMAVVDGGREAVTDFEVVERLGSVSRLHVRLRTGRTHQIRVHLAYIKHPVCGDAVYGRPDRRLQRPALHAMELSFVHPGDGAVRTFTSEPPPALLEYLSAARGSR